MSEFRVLVIGGYGSFGRWISKALAKDPQIQVIVAGHREDQARLCAEAICRELKTNVESLFVDAMDTSLSVRLINNNIDVVIHTSGPFQGQTYHVAQACIDAGIHYIDLADGREFVSGITKLDAAAKHKNIAIISGASTVPGLSSAIINELLPKFKQLKSIEYSIVPGNKGPKGLATIQAILSYTGNSFKRWENSKWCTAYGWQDLRLHNFGEDLGKRWVASCNIPDLEIFPDKYKNLESIKFYAGLELKLLHFALWGMSWISRIKLVNDWSNYAKPITKMSQWFDPFGSDKGGMLVKLEGITSKGKYQKINWRLIAKDGHGPRIPTVASIILTKKLARNTLAFRGAAPCVGMFSLNEFTKEIEHLNITQKIN